MSNATEKTVKAASSVGRNSLIMASGTLASRLTGQIRTILLAGALGVTGIAADAYQVGSQIPQVVFNILAGGLLNAILVPQIVKAFKQRDFASRINKLLTLSILVLGAFTLLLMLATPVLVNIYIDSGWTGPQKALANAFTLWCMPQVFFYGLYTVLGQVLAAKDRFGAYAWSSVGANVISCIGFGAFIVLFGNAKSQPLDFWTNDKIALSAGTWTIGVALQALILIVPLTRLGLKLKPEFGFHGIGLRSMGKVAAWSLGMVVLDQLAGIVNTRITTGAPVATGDRLGTAGSQAYMQGFQIWILPYSLITVSLATAIFPRLSRAFAERRVGDARTELSGALRTSGAIMIFFTAVFLAIPVPIVRSLLPSVSATDASFMAIALVGLAFGLLPSSAALLMRRTFFAYEDGRSPFMLSLIQNVTQVITLLICVQFVDAHYWVGVVGASIAFSNIVLLPIAYTLIRRRMEGRIDGHRIVELYAKTAIAGVVVAFVGLFLSPVCQRLVGADLSGPNPHMGWVQAVVISAIVGIVMAVVYIVLLYLMKVTELTVFLRGFARRFIKRSASTSNSDATSATSGAPQAKKSASSLAKNEPVQQARTSSAPRIAKTTGTLTHGAPEKAPLPSRMATDTNIGSVRHMIPAIGDTINNRYTLIALYRSEPGLSAWLANDHTLVRDCQLFIISDSSKLAKVNAIASSLALSRDSHFTHVLHLQKEAGVSVIVTETDAGVSLHEFLSDSSHAPLSVDAMRTITGEIADAADILRKVSLNHQAISTHTVRLTSTSVTLADAPVSPLLTTPIKPSSFNDSDEMLAVRQIAAVLFEMVTGTEFDPNANAEQTRLTFNTHQAEVPAEFASICTRALGIEQEDGSTPVPIFTLVELLALLGSWTEPDALTKNDMSLPSKQGAASIESTTLAPIEPRNIVDVPESLVATDTIEEVGGDDQQSPWRANQLLFDGDDAVEEIDSDSPNFLSAFESSFHNSMDQMDEMGNAFTDDSLSTVQPTQALQVTTPSRTLAGENDGAGADPDAPTDDAIDIAAAHTVHPVAPLIPEGAGTGPTNAGTAATQADGQEPAKSAEAASDTAIENTAADDTAAKDQTAVPLPSNAEMEAAAQAGAGTNGEQTVQPAPRTTRSARSARSARGGGAGSVNERQSSLADFAARGENFEPDADELENPDFVDENLGEVTSIIQPIPVAFEPTGTPEPTTAAQTTANPTPEEPKKKSVVGRNIALVVAAIAMIAALIWAIFHLGITPTNGNGGNQASTWSIDANNAPSPTGESSDDTSKKATSDDSKTKSSQPKDTKKDTSKKETTVTTADKNAKKVPTPAVVPVTNTTAYSIASTDVVRNVSGVTGVGVHIRLSQAESVQRIRITAQTGGGKAAIYANATAADPQHGGALAEFSFAENQQVTQVDLPQPVKTQDIVIWVSQQPQAGFFYKAITVY